MALHEQCVGKTDEWYTPPHVFEAMAATFDMDVASPGSKTVPWVPSKSHLTKNSLDAVWNGFVWMNPPFGARNGLVPWLDKFFRHNNGIALVQTAHLRHGGNFTSIRHLRFCSLHRS